jgi:flavin-dependent dehydrogenase
MNPFDVVVIGGGPAGASAALTLARGGMAVAVIEAEAFPRRKVCGEYVSATNLSLFDELGVGEAFRRQAGPEIRRTSVFCGEARVEAPLCALGGAWGRALGRDVLDTLLLKAAREAGAIVLQPFRAIALGAATDRVLVHAAGPDGIQVVEGRVGIAAHGSWRPGPLPTHLAKRRRAADMFGFKAHYAEADLPRDLMPLLAFPGGYGGMVTCDRGRVSLSFCLRRDAMKRIRAERPGLPAAEAATAHLLAHCAGAAEVLRSARRLGTALSAGPIRPGFRPAYAQGLFRVGNLAVEAHPVIAEGISMAAQSGWMLGRALLAQPDLGHAAQRRAARAYRGSLRRAFALRVVAAGVASRLCASTIARSAALVAVASRPDLLAFGARLSGKYRHPAELRACGRDP